MLSKLNLAIHAALIGIIAWLVISIKGLGPIAGLEDRLQRCAEEKTRIVQASEDAARAFNAAQAAETARQQRIKENADTDYQTRLDAAVRAARRYRERLPAPSFGGPPGGTSAVPESADPQLPADAPAGSVMVSAADLDTCAADYAYAQAAYEWAQALGD